MSYLDNYDKIFTDYQSMINEIKANTADTAWLPGIHSKTIKVSAFTEIEAQEMADKAGVPYDIASDTALNTALVLTYGTKTYMLRNTAIASLLETAKINGAALRRLSTYQLAEVVNICLTVARGDSLLLFRGGKVCACLSDGQYKIIPIQELLDITLKTIADKFGNSNFIQGQHNFQTTSAIWELPDAQDALLEKYDQSVPTHTKQLYGHNFMPAVQFVTSDVGLSAATLIPLFKLSSGAYFRINDGIRVEHKRYVGKTEGIEKYEEDVDAIFSKFTDVEETLKKMAECSIQHPLNALVGMSKKAGIPKKYVSDAYEEIEQFTMGRPCFMDDIYLSIANSVYNTAKTANVSFAQKSNLEEMVAKILSYNWTDFDVAGVVSW